MTAEDRHKALHQAFDELLACFIIEHPDRRKILDTTKLAEFIVWSHQMTQHPTCEQQHELESK